MSNRLGAGTPPSGRFADFHALRPLAVLLMGATLLRTSADLDLWGHVRFGLDALDTWTLPRTDPYSFTQDVPWINHEWLSEVAMGLAYRTAGAPGLQALKWFLFSLAFVLIDGVVRHKSEIVRFGALATCALALLTMSAAIRPQVWTVLLIVATFRLLHAGGRAIWAIPAVFALWANVHGGWVLGLGVLGTTLGGRWLSGSITLRRAMGIWLPSLLATLATPYGFELWHFIGSTVRLGRADISEWQPLWRSTPDMIAVWFGGIAIVAFGAWRQRGRTIAVLPTLLMLAVAALKVNRLVPLFVVTLVVLLAPLEEDTAHDDKVDWSRNVVDTVGVIFGLLLILPAYAPTCLPVPMTGLPDRSSTLALKAVNPSGRVVTFYDWGQYILFHFRPGLRVSIDGRRETVYSDATLAKQYAIAQGSPAGLAWLARVNPEYVWLPLPHARHTLAWLERSGYRTDVRTASEFIAVRQDLPPVVPGHTHSETRCFPGP